MISPDYSRTKFMESLDGKSLGEMAAMALSESADAQRHEGNHDVYAENPKVRKKLKKQKDTSADNYYRFLSGFHYFIINKGLPLSFGQSEKDFVKDHFERLLPNNPELLQYITLFKE
jgi:hypothetical protein